MRNRQVASLFAAARVHLNRGLLLLMLGAAGSLQAADPVLRADSPERYTVQAGDTLWDIAGRFLEEPWRWPEVWRANPAIGDPDFIYPGDVIELDAVQGRLVLRRGPDLPTVRLSPQIRRETGPRPVPALPVERISAHFSQDLVLGTAEFEAAPGIVAEGDGHALISSGDLVFASGQWPSQPRLYDLVRRGRDLQDPDTGVALGVEALVVGQAELVSTNAERAVLRVSRSTREIKPGDRLIPHQATSLESSYFPAPPPFAVDAAIISLGAGRAVAGRNDSLLLNVGASRGIEPGQLLTVLEPPQIPRGSKQEFPGKVVGTVLVYRVFDDSSLALVLSSNDAIRVNDRVVASP